MTPSQRQGVVWMASLLALVVTVSAGFWQLGRAEQKQQAHAQLIGRQALPPWTNAEWPCGVPAEAASLPQHRPAVLRGHWLADRTVFLDNRPMDGASGFVVVTPLRLSGGAHACGGRVVLVQRGWVPRDPRDRLHLPALYTPADEVQVSGRVLSALSEVYQLGEEPRGPPSGGPLIRQNASMAFWSDWLGQSPLAGALLQLQAEAPSVKGDVLRRHWSQPGLGHTKHLAYAAQWFAMAALIAGLTVWFQIIYPSRPRQHVPS